MKCQICDIPGYKEFVLTTVTSPYLEKIDDEEISMEDGGLAKNEYIESIAEL